MSSLAEGPISSVEFKAPHVWVHVTARDTSSQERTYSAEWSNPTRLERDPVSVGDIARHVERREAIPRCGRQCR